MNKMTLDEIINELQEYLNEANKFIKKDDPKLAKMCLDSARAYLKKDAHRIFAKNENDFRLLIGYYYHTKTKYRRYYDE